MKYDVISNDQINENKSAYGLATYINKLIERKERIKND